MSRNRRNRNGQQSTGTASERPDGEVELSTAVSPSEEQIAPLTEYAEVEQAMKILQANRDPDYVPPGFGHPANVETVLAAEPDSPKARVLESIRRRTGRAAKTNRTCPKCGEETFLVEWSKEQPDGSTFRERRCKTCGHVGERIAPAEKEPE